MRWVQVDPVPTKIILNDLQKMNQHAYRGLFTKRNLTLSISNTALNPGSRTKVKDTAPSNSHLILANSPAIHRISLPRSVAKVSVELLAVECKAKLSRIVDKRGDVASLSVERAVGTQSRPPLFQRTSKSTSWMLGSFEKSKERSEASTPST